MTITVVGDLADPLSFLASQRVDQIGHELARGPHGVAVRAWQLAHRAGHPAAAQFNGLLHYLTQPPTLEGAAMTEQNKVLDVRQEIPARRHELIFQTYTDLQAGDSFVLVNDHDPKPLYYQFAAEHPNQFEWEYLEQGPQVWQVRIGRPAA